MSFPLCSLGVSRRRPTTRREGFHAEHARHTRADAPPRNPVAGAYPGVPLARDPARATWRRRCPRSRLSTSHPHHPSPRRPRCACGWGYSGKGARRTRSPRAHPHPRSAKPPFWFSGGAERRHNRRARTTTHTTPSSRRVAYIARAPLAGSPVCALFRGPQTAPRRARTPRCTLRLGS